MGRLRDRGLLDLVGDYALGLARPFVDCFGLAIWLIMEFLMIEVDYIPTSYLHLRERQAFRALQKAGWSFLDIAIAFQRDQKTIMKILKWESDGMFGEAILEYPLSHGEYVPRPDLLLRGQQIDDLADRSLKK